MVKSPNVLFHIQAILTKTKLKAPRLAFPNEEMTTALQNTPRENTWLTT